MPFFIPARQKEERKQMSKNKLTYKTANRGNKGKKMRRNKRANQAINLENERMKRRKVDTEDYLNEVTSIVQTYTDAEVYLNRVATAVSTLRDVLANELADTNVENLSRGKAPRYTEETLGLCGVLSHFAYLYSEQLDSLCAELNQAMPDGIGSFLAFAANPGGYSATGVFKGDDSGFKRDDWSEEVNQKYDVYQANKKEIIRATVR